jgi:hypothetical protein
VSAPSHNDRAPSLSARMRSVARYHLRRYGRCPTPTPPCSYLRLAHLAH